MKKVFNHLTHQHIAIFAFWFAILGMFWARAIMATGIIILLGNALFNKNIKQHFAQLLQHKVLMSFVAIFLLFLISGLWSDNMQAYTHNVQLHLPFLGIAIGIFSFKRIDDNVLQQIGVAFIIGCVGCCIWSLGHYFSDKQMYDLGYSVSHVIPTPFKKDHIRFSIAVVLAIWFCYWFIPMQSNQIKKYALMACGVFMIIYLHILSVKTGLISFYLLFIYTFLQLLLNKKNRKFGLLGLCILITIPIIAFYTSQSFYNKLYYTQFSYVEMKNNALQPNISDEGRLISYKLGLEVMQQHQLLGTGSGDMLDAMKHAYTKHFGSDKTLALLPHNQAMVMMLVAGIFGLMVYCYFLFIPLLMHYRNSVFFIGFWIIFLLPQLIEPMHETQYGIAIHILFFALIVRYLDFKNNKGSLLVS
jgi:O-antigen ligase